jgi:hypothetical protein
MLSTGDSFLVITLAGVGALIVAIWMFRVNELYHRIGKGGTDVGPPGAEPDIPSELAEINEMRAAIAMLRQRRGQSQPDASATMSTIDHDLDRLLATAAPELLVRAREHHNSQADAQDR